MFVLITYDVNTETPLGKTRLRKVAKLCVDYGQRVQKSVFECNFNFTEYKIFIHKIKEIIDNEQDSIRVYHLGKKENNKIEVFGKDVAYKITGDLIF